MKQRSPHRKGQANNWERFVTLGAGDMVPRIKQHIINGIARVLIAMCGAEPTQLNAVERWEKEQCASRKQHEWLQQQSSPIPPE